MTEKQSFVGDQNQLLPTIRTGTKSTDSTITKATF
jgi:hypothetical protein